MWISYSDSEVSVFHPLCEEAIKNSLKNLGLESTYRVIHHQLTGSLEMDYAIQNITTGKYLCVVEVKRTPADINSARYQFQAMSYVQMNDAETEKPFYILTNLEYAFCFRYDSTRPRVFQQMLKPGLHSVGDFSKDSRDEFVDKLSNFFSKQIDDFVNNRYDYLVTLEQFANHMERIKSNPKLWKSSLAVLLYEYIRGSFTFIKRNELPDIRVFRNDIIRICNEAAKINFKEIFNYDSKQFAPSPTVDNDTLINIFDFGLQNVSGDSVAGILHQIVSAGHEHEGEVPTDLELGRLVSVLVNHVHGSMTSETIVCDPAAGSGNLISAAIDVLGLVPSQIVVNDWNTQLLELLSLRLGLNYVRTISLTNSPLITGENVVDLDKSYFESIDVIIMNPPFVAGINCVGRKQEFYRKIKRITGKDAKSKIGQMPLEAVFLELLTLLLKPGTTVACIFPKTHLLARGVEAKVIRNIMLNNFGLRAVFNYPGGEIFSDVVKDTCVLIGKTMEPSENIEVLSSYEEIPNIDLHRFQRALNSQLNLNFSSIMPGIVGKSISYETLKNKINDGWRELNSEMVEAINFVRQNIEMSPHFEKLKMKDWNIKRGPAGNIGGSDLVFFSSREELRSKFLSKGVNLKPAMRNAKLDSFVVGNGDAEFLDISLNSENLIEEIVDEYMILPARNGRQQRQTKSKEQWLKILERESRGKFGANSVLIPRAIRRIGRIYLSETEIFVSTNFVVCTLDSYTEALLLSTWMSTIFYQLICEVSSKDQEGMRKMEVEDIYDTFVPDLSIVDQATINRLVSEVTSSESLDLQRPTIREIDKIWAEILFGTNATVIVEEARRLLEFAANRRSSL